MVYRNMNNVSFSLNPERVKPEQQREKCEYEFAKEANASTVAMLSQQSFSRDWDNVEEDEAWEDL